MRSTTRKPRRKTDARLADMRVQFGGEPKNFKPMEVNYEEEDRSSRLRYLSHQK